MKYDSSHITTKSPMYFVFNLIPCAFGNTPEEVVERANRGIFCQVAEKSKKGIRPALSPRWYKYIIPQEEFKNGLQAYNL